MAGRVLIVDSDPNLCGIVEKALRESGYDVEARHDGTAALDAVSTDDFDLALIDIQLPRRDGFDVLESIRALPIPACDIPVFLLSATRISAAYKERARTARATAIVKKPISLDKLNALVKKHIKETPPRVVERAQSEEPAASEGPKRARAPKRERSIALEGELRDLDFAALLHHLHGLRATGALILTNGRKRKVVQVRDGYPVAVKSNLVGECFGNLLVQRGVIPIRNGVRLVQRTVYKPVLVSGLDAAAEQVWQYQNDRNLGFKSMRYRWFVSLVDAQAYYQSIAVRR